MESIILNFLLEKSNIKEKVCLRLARSRRPSIRLINGLMVSIVAFQESFSVCEGQIRRLIVVWCSYQVIRST